MFSHQSRHILRLHSYYNRRRQLLSPPKYRLAATASDANSITAEIADTNPLPKHTSIAIDKMFSIIPNKLVVIAIIVVIIVVIVRVIVIIVRVVVCVCVMRIVEGITTTSILRGAA